MSNNILKSYMGTAGLASIMIDPIITGLDFKIEKEEQADEDNEYENEEIIFDDEISNKIISSNEIILYLPFFQEHCTYDAIQILDVILKNKYKKL